MLNNRAAAGAQRAEDAAQRVWKGVAACRAPHGCLRRGGDTGHRQLVARRTCLRGNQTLLAPSPLRASRALARAPVEQACRVSLRHGGVLRAEAPAGHPVCAAGRGRHLHQGAAGAGLDDGSGARAPWPGRAEDRGQEGRQRCRPAPGRADRAALRGDGGQGHWQEAEGQERWPRRSVLQHGAQQRPRAGESAPGPAWPARNNPCARACEASAAPGHFARVAGRRSGRPAVPASRRPAWAFRVRARRALLGCACVVDGGALILRAPQSGQDDAAERAGDHVQALRRDLGRGVRLAARAALRAERQRRRSGGGRGGGSCSGAFVRRAARGCRADAREL